MTQAIQSYQCSIDHDLHAALQRFWVQEEAQLSAQTIFSIEEQKCEDHFCNSHSRNSSKRYVVRLPFQKSPKAIGDSRPAASRMLSSMIRRFSCDHKLKCLYSDFLREYESLGHMTRVPESIPEPQQFYYLPHHGVLKESSSSTKLRVVFNGSCRTSSGCSLNEGDLHIGAKLQTDLSDVILWWRQFSYVFSADMEKMFRQILVHPDDLRFQRILWSPESSQKTLIYQLATVTYGLGPAPFLANRVMKQLTKDEGHRFPLATDVLLRGTYVDDCFGGADSPQDANEVIQQLDNLCKSGGFDLLKWTANDSTILADLSIMRHASSTSIFLDGSPLFRTLGIIWNPVSDAFVFLAINTENDTTPTKRKVLSRIAQVFDPVGWLALITVRAKIFMQELWLTKLYWDDQLPESLSQRWNQFLNQLQDISHISIPRWNGTSANMLTLEIHGFSDASRDAMAAVVYLRVLNKTNDATISLITAKTKVAPIKKMTIPWLELCAATLLTKQVAHVGEVLNISQAP
ncbi:PREDICTED: uncharacterized protein LOC108363978 [Rhagoletis zephyria]|uniref:uncharacterized protein LOC108363978 n=1 Tax=Rhagoletis zephyria TaxID=28612 RepID=UPI0008115885|nr:PREDICTED: uncharacterized protein LOC108363978 [Rhagoletis zephyria]